MFPRDVSLGRCARPGWMSPVVCGRGAARNAESDMPADTARGLGGARSCGARRWVGTARALPHRLATSERACHCARGAPSSSRALVIASPFQRLPFRAEQVRGPLGRSDRRDPNAGLLWSAAERRLARVADAVEKLISRRLAVGTRSGASKAGAARSVGAAPGGSCRAAGHGGRALPESRVRGPQGAVHRSIGSCGALSVDEARLIAMLTFGSLAAQHAG
jgi:hypothetical protein